MIVFSKFNYLRLPLPLRELLLLPPLYELLLREAPLDEPPLYELRELPLLYDELPLLYEELRDEELRELLDELLDELELLPAEEELRLADEEELRVLLGRLYDEVAPPLRDMLLLPEAELRPTVEEPVARRSA